MDDEEKDFPEIGIIERFFRMKNSTFPPGTERSSPEMTLFRDGHWSVTYLARTSFCPNRRRLELSRPTFFKNTPEEAISEALLAINHFFRNPMEFSSWEELDLFLSSEGF